MKKIVYGTVLYVHDFDFGDGERRNKYVVILGAKTGHNLAGIVTTSKTWRSASDDDYCPIDDEQHVFFPSQHGRLSKGFLRLMQHSFTHKIMTSRGGCHLRLPMSCGHESRIIRMFPRSCLICLRSCKNLDGVGLA